MDEMSWHVMAGHGIGHDMTDHDPKPSALLFEPVCCLSCLSYLSCLSHLVPTVSHDTTPAVSISIDTYHITQDGWS